MEQMLIDDHDNNLKAGDINFLTKFEYQMSSSGIFEKIEEAVINNR